MSLSIKNYSASVLLDANKCTEHELTWIQRTALKIIGIYQMTAYWKYNIKSLKTQIEDQRKTISERIIENNDHPISKRLLTKNTSSITTINANKFAPNPANTGKYPNRKYAYKKVPQLSGIDTQINTKIKKEDRNHNNWTLNRTRKNKSNTP